MTEKMNLKEIEKKAWTSYFQDGLWDIYLGLLFFNMGINDLFEQFGEFRPISGIIIVFGGMMFLILGKKYITVPRLGLVKFGQKRQINAIKLSILILIAVVTTAILFFVPQQFQLSTDIPIRGIIISLLLFTIFTGMAYLLDFKRLYVYAIVFSVAMFLAEYIHEIFGRPTSGIIIFAIPGLIVMLIGFFHLIKFSKTYQKPTGAI